MFWLLFSFFVFLLAHLGDYYTTRNQHVVLVARIGLIFVLSYAISLCGFGADRDNYLDLYDRRLDDYYESDLLSWISLDSKNLELGYYIICRICKIFGLSALGMLFVVAVITNTFVVKTFYRFRYPVFIFFLYILSLFYVQQTNILRQMMAVSLSMYSLKYVIEKKLVRYLIWVFIAILCHKSAFIMLVFIPFCYDKVINYKRLNLIFLIIWLGSLLFVIPGVANRIPVVSTIISMTRYAKYVDSDLTLGNEQQIFDKAYNVLVLFYFLCGYKKPHRLAYIFAFIMGAVITNVSVNLIVVQRMSFYFSPFFCAYSPELLADNSFANKKKCIKYYLFLPLILYRGRFLVQYILEGSKQIGVEIGNLSDIFA